jgi:hypothetical protein
VVKQHLNSLKCVIAYYKPLYPTPVQFAASITPHEQGDNNATVVTSNTSPSSNDISHHALGMLVKPLLTVANMGATLLFLTKGAPCQNKRHAINPVTVTLPDGCKIKSMHVCNVMIPGLPTVLTGHIMSDMTTASLFGIRVLCKAGCQVLFDDNKFQVIFNGTVILTGYKDIANDLWMLPIHPFGMPQTVGTLQNGYIRNVPLPRVAPRVQRASHVMSHGAEPCTCYSQVPRVPTCSKHSRLLTGLGGTGPSLFFPVGWCRPLTN